MEAPPSSPTDVPVPPPGFELLRPLGAGSSSVVWAAACVALGDTVALKWPRAATPEAAADLRREAELLDVVDHPNVVRAYDVVEGGGGPVLVLEHAPGGSLADALVRRGRLPAGEVARLGAGMARGLDALHRVGLLHGDLKPANVLLGDGGRPLLADLGAARRAGTDPLDGTVTGSAPYLDPAVLAGGPPDERSDVYALGVTLHEALRGALPGTASPGDDLSLDACGEALVALLARATDPEPSARPQRAGDLVVALEALEPAMQETGPPTGVPHVPVPLAPLATAVADERATRSFGPRPTAPVAEPAPSRRPGTGVALAAAAVTVALLVSPVGPLRPEAVRADDGAEPTCEPVADAPGTVAADLDGDGCPTALRWDGWVLTVAGTEPPARYALVGPDDTLLIGDWDCDGRDAPALHRATGETVVFDRLPAPGEALHGRRSPGPAGATATVGTGEDGCDAVEVSP